MPERIPQSTTLRVPLQAYLSSDHVTPATGKTIAVTVSKNGAAYANPSAGATNATEVASGSYYVDISTTDTATLGPLFVLGSVSGIDNVVAVYNVVKATNGGFTALPDTGVTTNGSLITSGTGTAQLSVGAGKAAATLGSGDYSGNTVQTGDNFARIGAPAGASIAADIATKSTYAGGAVASVTGNVGGNVVGSVGTVSGAVGSVTGNVGGSVGSVTAPVTAGTVTDKTGYSLATAPPTAAQNATAFWTDTTAGDFTVANSPGAILFGFPPLDAGVAQGGSATTVTLAAGATSAAIGPNGLVTIWGSGVPTQSARIVSFNTSTKVATIEGAWLVAPNGTTNYAVDWSSEFRTTLNAVTHTGATVPTVTAVGSVSGSVAGDVAGKVLGGGSSTITAVGAEATLAPATNVLDSGTCQAGSTGTSVVLQSGSTLSSGIAGTGVVSIDSGTGQGQWRRITAYNASTKVATVPAWYTTPDGTSVYSVTSEDQVNADAQAIVGSAAAARGLSAMGLSVFQGVVSSDTSPTSTAFSANPTGSTGLSVASGFYSTPNSLIVFFSGADAAKTSSCTNYVYSGAVGTFTLAQALPVAPAVGDKFLVISIR